jgi:hypothetical protein
MSLTWVINIYGGHTRSLVVVRIEAAGQPCQESHLDEEDDGVKERLDKMSRLALACTDVVDESCPPGGGRDGAQELTRR